jgi:hypothetical protein
MNDGFLSGIHFVEYASKLQVESGIHDRLILLPSCIRASHHNICTAKLTH